MGLLQPSSVRGYPVDRKSESHSNIPQSHITLLTLGVLPAYQRRGIGRSLVHGVVQRLEASCVATEQPHHPASPDQTPNQDSKITVLVQVQVAQSNSAGKCFYSRLGMIDQQGFDDPPLRLGLGSRTSVMAGVMCI
ncbi:hypothetical protein J3R83DRAFT_8558 [Lanmaoa asiatica]|nr:hypothetical protein J3R83DRAFT_8558 [Lanmaoa asiatica]